MLRIGGGAPPPQGPPQDPQAAPPAPPMEPQALPMMLKGKPPSRFSKDKLDQETVVYQGGDQGPFKCANCVYFKEDGSCSIVDGEIDPEGICNVFTSKGGDQPSEGDMLPVPPDDGGEGDEQPASSSPSPSLKAY